MIGLLRLVFAAAALVIIYIDPSEPDRLVAATYGSLAVFTAYSAFIYFTKGGHIPLRLLHWIDVGWCLLLVALSSGTSSIFFSFFFFCLLVASFRFGFAEGLRVTLVSAVLFSLVGYFAAPGVQGFELNRFLLRPVALLIIGYMIAYWGGREIESKRRLQLLKEVSKLSNPRFGIKRTLASICERVREFYDADDCLLLLSDAGSSSYFLYRSARGQTEPATVERVAPDAARPLLALPAAFAGVHCGQPPSLWERVYDLRLPAAATNGARAECERLASLLDADAFITLPVRAGGQTIGRVYVTCRGRRFGDSHLEFLQQIVEHVTPVVENIQLLDRMASDAAYEERQKISRDIHDSTIQPYIGLKYALGALRRKLAPGDALAGEVDELIEKAGEGIADLRRYVGELKGAKVARDSILLPAVRRQAERFQKFYGIEVEVAARGQVAVNDRLAAETFQIVNEGLSNVRRHTEAKRARISIESADGCLLVCIENDGAACAPADFVPRSVTERAQALGGTAWVERSDGHTTIAVEIPL